MSQENINAFIAKVQSDSGLLEQMKNVSEADGPIAIAKSAGFEITAGDLIRQQAKIASELSDDELEKVAGGTAAVVNGLRITMKASFVALGGTWLYAAVSVLNIEVDPGFEAEILN